MFNNSVVAGLGGSLDPGANLGTSAEHVDGLGASARHSESKFNNWCGAGEKPPWKRERERGSGRLMKRRSEPTQATSID